MQDAEPNNPESPVTKADLAATRGEFKELLTATKGDLERSMTAMEGRFEHLLALGTDYRLNRCRCGTSGAHMPPWLMPLNGVSIGAAAAPLAPVFGP